MYSPDQNNPAGEQNKDGGLPVVTTEGSPNVGNSTATNTEYSQSQSIFNSPETRRALVFSSPGSNGSPDVQGTNLFPNTGVPAILSSNIEILLSPEDKKLASLKNNPEDIAALIQNYIQIDNKLDTFFFETVDGMFEYLLFLILYKYLDIFGLYAEKETEQGPEQQPASSVMDVEEVFTTPSDTANTSPVKGKTGGARVNCATNFTNDNITNIQIIKLYKELNHDFKGAGKSLENMPDIRNFCLEYVEDYSVKPTDHLSNMYSSMMNGNTDEWNFYTSILEYYCEECGKFSDLTMIRYKSRTDKESGNKDYIIRDINSYPSGEDSYSKLFVEDDFLYRFQDNGTTNGLLSKLVDGEPNLDNSIKVIQNAPSLMDPATVHPINMTKFYPVQVDTQFREFQMIQDLNNVRSNEIQRIMIGGINQFFSYFNVPKVPGQNMMVEFVVFQDGRPIDIGNRNYQDWLNELTTNGNITVQNRNCPFFYQGIRINIEGTDPLELHVGDIAIPNIASLINSGYYLNPNIASYGTTVTRIIDKETRGSWERVVKFAKFIREKSQQRDELKVPEKLNDFLRFIIISMKSFGDSFQVYYSTAIQQQEWEYNDISEKTYLSSSDKNTGAEKMLYDSPFLLNGCGIRPYQELQNRFPDFFNVELTENELNDNGDVGSKHTTSQYKYGSSKALLTNIKSAGKDYKRYVQILCNQIVGIVGEVPSEENANIIERFEIDFRKIVRGCSQPETFQDETTLNIVGLKRESSGEPKVVLPLGIEKNSEKLQQLYNSLKIYQETNDALDNKINTFLNDFELQEKYLTKLIDLKRSPTTEELDALVKKLNNDPQGDKLEADLNKLVSSATGIEQNSFTQKITKFIGDIKKEVNNRKEKLKAFIEKLKNGAGERTSQRAVSRIKRIKEGLMGIMAFVNPSTTTGGKNRTIKNRHAYMKKYTRKHGHSTNKRKTRHASQEKRKHKTQRKYHM